MSTVALKQVENELGITLPGKVPLKQTDASRVGITIGIEIDGSATLNSDIVGDPRDQRLSLLRARLVEQVQLFDDKTPVIIAPQPSVVKCFCVCKFGYELVMVCEVIMFYFSGSKVWDDGQIGFFS